MKVIIGCDHGGYKQKEIVKNELVNKGYDVVDVGTNSLNSCDYPLYAKKVADEVVKNSEFKGILFCTSGEGMVIAANKIKGCRAGIGYNDEVSSALRRHNDANIIAFGSNYMSDVDVLKRIDIFLNTKFEGGRHEQRVKQLKDLEK